MIGKCPNCSISLKEPPLENRETNEVVITLRYRYFIDNDKPLASIEKKGYCDVCDAKVGDLKKQVELMADRVV